MNLHLLFFTILIGRPLIIQNLHLFPRVDGAVIDFPIELGADEVQSTIIPERPPFSVDKEFRLPLLSIIHLAVLCLLHVASVAAGAWITDKVR